MNENFENTPSTVAWGSPSQDEIALRAHQLWCQQGCPHGHDMDNWLEAERQLREEHGRRRPSEIPASEDVPLGGRTGTFAALSDDAPLATKVDEQVGNPGGAGNSQSPTSLDL